VKINAECALAALSPRGGAPSATDFDQSEWEIMYPHFVKEDLVDPSDRVNKKCLMFYACDAMVSSFSLFALCCALSHVCLYFVFTYFHRAYLCLLPSSGKYLAICRV
jgi:hypothetical protein